MRRGVAAAAMFLVLLAAAPLAGADPGPPPAGTSMTVSASTHVAGARAVRLTFTLRYVMQCGYPGAGPLVMTFPAVMKLSKHLAADAVRMAGKAVAAKVDGRQVTVSVPPHKGVLCDLMGRAFLTVTFTRAAKLSTPARAGSFRFTATHGKRSFTARLATKPAA